MLRDYNKFINEAIDDDDEDLDYLEQMLKRAAAHPPSFANKDEDQLKAAAHPPSFTNNDDEQPDPEPDNGFKENEIVLYQKNGSDRDGETAKFIKIRDDGKYSIRFNDGVKMAVLAKNVYKLEEQPNKNIHKIDVPEDWNKNFQMPNEFFGKKMAKNVFPNDEPISKDGVFIKLKSFPDGVKLKALDSNSIEIKNVLNLFPELNNIGFEVTGDDIAYTDDFLSIDELLEELRERGFTAHSV